MNHQHPPERSGLAPLSASALVTVFAGLICAAPSQALAWRATPAPPAPISLFHPSAVFGTDERVLLPSKPKGLQDKIGLLFNPRSRTVCTAFCVAPDIIATAGHCLFRVAGERPPRISEFWFARSYDAVRDYARVAGHSVGATAQHVISGAASLNMRPPIDATKDWAFVRLARRVCSKGVLPIRPLSSAEIMAAAEAKRIFQVSYHRDFTPWKLAITKPCTITRNFRGVDWKTIAGDFSDSDALLLHTCDTGGASSGSPLLLETERGPEVVGINVGTYVQSRVEMMDGQVTRRFKAETVANTGVSALAFAGKLDAFRRAVILSTPAQIRDLQEALKHRQLYTGAIDGAYGPALRLAIETYEQGHGLTVTGLPTRALLKRLQGASAEKRRARPAKS